MEQVGQIAIGLLLIVFIVGCILALLGVALEKERTLYVGFALFVSSLLLMGVIAILNFAISLIF